MIYHAYWASISRGSYAVPAYWKDYLNDTNPVYAGSRVLAKYIGRPSLDTKGAVARIIRDKAHKMVFIVTNDQLAGFKEWLKEEKLQDHVAYVTPTPLVNQNYGENSAKKLHLYIMASPESEWVKSFKDGKAPVVSLGTKDVAPKGDEDEDEDDGEDYED